MNGRRGTSTPKIGEDYGREVVLEGEKLEADNQAGGRRRENLWSERSIGADDGYYADAREEETTALPMRRGLSTM